MNELLLSYAQSFSSSLHSKLPQILQNRFSYSGMLSKSCTKILQVLGTIFLISATNHLARPKIWPRLLVNI